MVVLASTKWNPTKPYQTSPPPQKLGCSSLDNIINMTVNINVLSFALHVYYKISSFHQPGPHPKTPLLYPPVPWIEAIVDYAWVGLRTKFSDVINKGVTMTEQGQPVKAIEHLEIRLKIENVYVQVSEFKWIAFWFWHICTFSCHAVMK